MRVGTSVRPFSRTFPYSESISLAMEQELAVAVRDVADPPLCAYSAIDAPTSQASPSADVRVRLPELDLAVARRLHLGAREHDTSLDALEKLVVVPRAAVVGDQLGSGRLGHGRSVGRGLPRALREQPSATSPEARSRSDERSL